MHTLKILIIKVSLLFSFVKINVKLFISLQDMLSICETLVNKYSEDV